MEIQGPFFLCLLALASLLATPINGAKPSHFSMPLNRSSFPPGFIFGAGSAAYQSEGAAFKDGRGWSIWDTFVRKFPEKIADRSTGDIADDFYHRYKDDIKLMKKIGLDSFRFSLSWPRLLPKGKISGGVNPLGVKFYNDLINDLLAEGIIPFVTLFHFDLPQTLEDEYGGLLGGYKLVKDFEDYVDFCFKTFGDRVKHWVTMNEPNGYCINAYNAGSMAPGRCSSYVGNCPAGNSATEPYIAGHNLLLCHATTVKLYKTKYQASQKGEIGITLVTNWAIPKYKTSASRIASLRAIDFFFGWFANPITYGKYPESMESTVGNRLPKFNASESQMLKVSYDFLALNYYTTNYAEYAPESNGLNFSFTGDRRVTLTSARNGVNIGTATGLSWLFIYPQGLLEFVLYVNKTYNNPPIIITENGMADLNNASVPVHEAIKDSLRIRYHHSHLSYLLKAIKAGVRVKGYFVWSFFDDFEWDAGYTARFGMVYVDFKDNLKRYLKYSAYWLKMFLLK